MGTVWSDESTRRFRILSIDGGPWAAASVRLLEELVARQPHLLQRTDMFAGSSFGTLLSLYLASRNEEELANGVETVQNLRDITDRYYSTLALDFTRPGAFVRSSVQALQFVTGFSTIARTDKAREFLVELFGDRRMSDLNRYVAAVTFDLRAGPWSFPGEDAPDGSRSDDLLRSWGARVHHNLAPPRGEDELWEDGAFSKYYFGDWPDADLPLVEVFLRSSAMPLAVPVHAGFIDGMMFGNNPTMAAITLAWNMRRWINRTARRGGQSFGQIHSMDDILSLSLGGEDPYFVRVGRRDGSRAGASPNANPFDSRNQRLTNDRVRSEWFRKESNPDLGPASYQESERAWGWPTWMFALGDLFLLAEALISGDGRGVAFQAENVLSPGHHLRLTLSVPDAGRVLLTAIVHPATVISMCEESMKVWRKEHAVTNEGVVRHALELWDAFTSPLRGGAPPNGLSEGAYFGVLGAIEGIAASIVDGEEDLIGQRIKAVLDLLGLGLHGGNAGASPTLSVESNTDRIEVILGAGEEGHLSAGHFTWFEDLPPALKPWGKQVLLRLRDAMRMDEDPHKTAPAMSATFNQILDLLVLTTVQPQVVTEPQGGSVTWLQAQLWSGALWDFEGTPDGRSHLPDSLRSLLFDPFYSRHFYTALFPSGANANAAVVQGAVNRLLDRRAASQSGSTSE